MIDLINRDYADFVNLSSSLTGLNSCIHALAVPLKQLREEITIVSEVLSEAKNAVMYDLEKYDIMENYKQKLSTTADASARLKTLEGIFEKKQSPSDSEQEQDDANSVDFKAK